MRCQFPEPVPGGKEAADALAETMLPEGAHQRERDSLWFFLNRAGRMWDDDEDGPTGKACDSGGAVSRSEATSPPSREDRFLYGFNLVQTHTDTSIRRGARVMALALLSPYPFIQFLAEAAMVHALEECLLLAAASEEAAGEEGQEEVLRRLLACVNGLDLAAVPRPRPVERALMWRGVTARGVHDVGGDAARAYLPQVGWGLTG